MEIETETAILREVIKNQEIIIKNLEEQIEIYKRHEKEIDTILKNI